MLVAKNYWLTGDGHVERPEGSFFVMLGTSSFLARYKVYRKTTENLVPSWEQDRALVSMRYMGKTSGNLVARWVRANSKLGTRYIGKQLKTSWCLPGNELVPSMTKTSSN